jgi:hypothetical protein
VTAAQPNLSKPLVGALWAVAGIGGVVGAATLRVVLAGEQEIALSTRALKAGDAHGAAEHARRAAAWFAPAAPHVRVAYDRLVALGAAAEGLGDRELALFAYRGARTAALETRWILAPHDDTLALANAAIARLSAAAPGPTELPGPPAATLSREALDALSREDTPNAHWIVVLVGSALAWILGAVYAAEALTTGRPVSRHRAAGGACVATLGVLLYLLAIWRA